MNGERLQATVASLLAACYASNEPVAALHAELDRLWATGEWSQLQLAQLQLMALEKVKAIVGALELTDGRSVGTYLDPSQGRMPRGAL
jgi:hypothetical protein